MTCTHKDVIDWLRQQHTTARAARKSVHVWLQMALKMLIDRHSYLAPIFDRHSHRFDRRIVRPDSQTEPTRTALTENKK